jgi:hypothetical protein
VTDPSRETVASGPGGGRAPDASARGTAAVPGSRGWAEVMDEPAEACLADPEKGLDAAIEVRRRALGALAGDVLDSVATGLRNNLGVDLAARYRRSGQVRDLLDACSLGRQVLDATGVDDGHRIAAAVNLAGRLSLLARHDGYGTRLQEGLDLLQAELARVPVGDDEMAAEFMTAYHRYLATGAEPGAALARLQAEWARDRPALHYAPWIVVTRHPR